MKNKVFISILGLFTLLVTSCKKDFLNQEPNGLFLEPSVRELGAGSAESAIKILDPSMNGIYAYLCSYNTSFKPDAELRHDDLGQKAVDISTDLMTEDMVQTANHFFGFDYLLDNRDAPYQRTFIDWNFYYHTLRMANIIISQIGDDITDEKLKAIKGQALTIRAYCYLDLVQLYQQTYKGYEDAPGVPLITEPNAESKPRASLKEVYKQMEDDLKKAIPLLATFNRNSKNQIDQHVAKGFLARVYLNTERWSDAAIMANEARAGYVPMSGAEYNAGFSSINNAEWMWGAEISSTNSPFYASFFSHMDNLSPGYAGALGIYKLVDKKLFNQIPASDVRKNAFKAPGSPANPALPDYASLKFRDPGGFTGDYVYMRAAEMYLIEAEALARQGNNTQSAQVLFDLLKTRNPDYTLSANTGDALINEIILNRRIELWGEGFSLNDYKRWKKGIDRTGSNHRIDAQFVIPAGDKKFFHQLPQREFDTNKALTAADQNP